MSKVRDELFFSMTMMFKDNMVKTYDTQELTEESKLNYLRNIVQYCERLYDQTYESKHPKAQDGWLLLKDQNGEQHDVAYRGIWSIEKLKELMAAQFSVKPEDLHMTLVYDSFTAHESQVKNVRNPARKKNDLKTK